MANVVVVLDPVARGRMALEVVILALITPSAVRLTV